MENNNVPIISVIIGTLFISLVEVTTSKKHISIAITEFVLSKSIFEI